MTTSSPSVPLTSSPALSRHARRLLETLAESGATARETAARPGHLAVSAPRGRITSVLASLPAEAATPLLARDLARWNGASLVITGEGRTFLRRADAPAGLDGFQAQHRDVVREPRDPGEKPLTIDAAESPIAWLVRRRDRTGKPFLDPSSFEAGERFRRDITVAQFLPSVTSNWSAHGAAGRSDFGRTLLPSEVALAARQRVARALDAVGSDLAGVLVDACGFVKRLEVIEAEHGWPARSGKIVLRLALAQLARHYGLAESATGPASSRGLQHWGTADYRPAMDGADT